MSSQSDLLLENLRTAETADELIRIFRSIPELGQDVFRSIRLRDLIVSKRILLSQFCIENDDLVNSVGYLFLWIIPQHVEDPRRFEIGRKIFATREIADLFIDIFLPNARTQDNIYCIARSVCRVGYAHDGAKFFGTPAAVREITAIVGRAREPKAVQFAVTIINNLTHDDESQELRYIFAAPEHVKLLFDALDNATDPDVVAWVAGSLINTSLARKESLLQTYRSESAVNSFLNALETKAKSADSVDRVVRAMINTVIQSDEAAIGYQTPRATLALLGAFDFADEPIAVESLCSFISEISRKAPVVIRNLYKTPHAVSQYLKGVEGARDDRSANCWMINMIYVLVCDPIITLGPAGAAENDALTTPEAVAAIVTLQRKVEDEERHRHQGLFIISALANGREEVLARFVAAEKPFTAAQVAMLNVATERGLIAFLKDHGPDDYLSPEDDVERHRGLKLLLEKTADLVETSEGVVAVTEMLTMHHGAFLLMRDQLVDTILFSLLCRGASSSGDKKRAGMVAVVRLIGGYVQSELEYEKFIVDPQQFHHHHGQPKVIPITPRFTPASMEALLFAFETEWDAADDEGFCLAEVLPLVFVSFLESKHTPSECRAMLESRRLVEAIIETAVKVRAASDQSRMAIYELRRSFRKLRQISPGFNAEVEKIIDDVENDEKQQQQQKEIISILMDQTEEVNIEDEEEEEQDE